VVVVAVAAKEAAAAVGKVLTVDKAYGWSLTEGRGGWSEGCSRLSLDTLFPAALCKLVNESRANSTFWLPNPHFCWAGPLQDSD
jgi:hypothetical protein